MRNITVAKALELYADSLAAIGKSTSTVSTTRRILRRMSASLGEGKLVSNILPVHLRAFWNIKQADGSPLAAPSQLQLRRIVRSFLVWAVMQGMTDRLPVPAEEKALADRQLNKAGSKRSLSAKSSRRRPTANLVNTITLENALSALLNPVED